MKGTVQFSYAFSKRIGDGGSLIKVENWKITLESQAESLL
ncbi:MAG: hypothetical protein K0Q87_5459 [Neobacillus sp.]|jgi:hypothetical protein|nr:hypothetical protein [Neobacillus sp.]